MEIPYIFKLIEERLGGDPSRLEELFEEESILDDLAMNEKNGDFYYFRYGGSDGFYFIKNGPWFTCYAQERAQKQGYTNFDSFHEAAEHFLAESLIKEWAINFVEKNKNRKKWWEFWR